MCFYGFQKQNSSPNTIQEYIETAIFKLTSECVTVTGAGRTDSGVHARGQVVHFNLSSEWDTYTLQQGLNFYLVNISILFIEKVSGEFNARFSAMQRTYEYHIINREARLSVDKKRAWHVFYPLDHEKLTKGAQLFIGLHNFSAFKSARSPDIKVERSVEAFGITHNRERIIATITARSFLHNQVRMMIGSLVWYAASKITNDDIQTALKTGVKKNIGPTAPPYGLYFIHVKY